jgi:hypothetical protein
MWIAALADVIASKRAAGRPRDKAVLDILGKRCVKKANRRSKRRFAQG